MVLSMFATDQCSPPWWDPQNMVRIDITNWSTKREFFLNPLYIIIIATYVPNVTWSGISDSNTRVGNDEGKFAFVKCSHFVIPRYTCIPLIRECLMGLSELYIYIFFFFFFRRQGFRMITFDRQAGPLQNFNRSHVMVIGRSVLFSDPARPPGGGVGRPKHPKIPPPPPPKNKFLFAKNLVGKTPPPPPKKKNQCTIRIIRINHMKYLNILSELITGLSL